MMIKKIVPTFPRILLAVRWCYLEQEEEVFVRPEPELVHPTCPTLPWLRGQLPLARMIIGFGKRKHLRWWLCGVGGMVFTLRQHAWLVSCCCRFQSTSSPQESPFVNNILRSSWKPSSFESRLPQDTGPNSIIKVGPRPGTRRLEHDLPLPPGRLGIGGWSLEIGIAPDYKHHNLSNQIIILLA